MGMLDSSCFQKHCCDGQLGMQTGLEDDVSVTFRVVLAKHPLNPVINTSALHARNAEYNPKVINLLSE